MKKNLLIYSVLFCIIFSFYLLEKSAASGDEHTLHELTDLFEVATKQGINIESWTAYEKRDPIYVSTITEADQLIETIKNENPGFTWTDEEVHHHDYAKLVGINDHSQFNERMVIILYETHNQYEVSSTYQLSGTEWNDHIMKEVSNIIREEAVYYTVKGEFNNETQLPLQTIAQDVVATLSRDIEIKEGLVEDGFVSLSAFYDRWERFLVISETDQMNVQVGVRAVPNSEAATVTIGTPIITTEY